MSDLLVRLGSGSLATSLGEVVRDARQLASWTQAELARRPDTTQTAVSRIERGVASPLDLRVVVSVLDALGLTATLGVDGRHLADRRRQREPVHARMEGFQATSLGRRGFRTALESRSVIRHRAAGSTCSRSAHRTEP